jgi:hypothetical protein
MTGLLMLALLAAAPVHAETWTLWAHGTDHSGAEERQQVPGIATEAECWARIRTWFARFVDGHKTTAYYRDGTKYVVEFTLSPRHRGPARRKAWK